jgi:hypothetical protein
VSTVTDPVLIALTALWTAALADVNVRDGPQVNSEAANDWLFVGSDSDSPDPNSVMADAEEDRLTFSTKQETNRIKNSIIVRTGDTEIPPVRARAFTILAAAETALMADRTLGGTVMHAIVTGHQYYPTITTAGARVRIVFTVTYRAQI